MLSTSFQCPVTGETVIASYSFGRVKISAADDARNPETLEYCRKHTNKRCHSREEADEYIVRVSDGQTFGFY